MDNKKYTDNIDVLKVGSKILGTLSGLEMSGFTIIKIENYEIFVIADMKVLTEENIVNANKGCIITIGHTLRVKRI